ncbi:MAG: hypothetical protein KY468_06675 [Armatimonadetes bacterium]|nr:hypothetical protein [Armatimonadota bacterium]
MIPEEIISPPGAAAPSLYSPDDLALSHFGQPKEALVFGASSQAGEYVRVKRALEAMLRQDGHPYREAARVLWDEIHHRAVEKIRALLAQQGVPTAHADASMVESLLGVATLRQWPDVATAVLMEDLNAGDRFALIRAGNIDENTDFLALHLRSLLGQPEMREAALDFMILLSAQASVPELGRLYESPTQRHLAAALATGETPPDEIEGRIRALNANGKLQDQAGSYTLGRLRFEAKRYAELVRSVEREKGPFPAWIRALHPDEKRFEAFFRAEEEAFARSIARDLLHQPDERSDYCRKLAQIAYVEEGRGLEERHRAEERLMLLSNVSAERLLGDPERALAEWLNPYRLVGPERDMILTVVAMEDLRSGGAAARILRGALQNPLFRDPALGIMIEVVFRNPPGMMEEQLLEALANEELGPKDRALAYVRRAAEETLGSIMAAWFMDHLKRRLASFTPGAGALPFLSLPTATRRRGVPFLRSSLENRMQRSFDLLDRHLGVPTPLGLWDSVLHLFRDEETGEILRRYRAFIDPEPLEHALWNGSPGVQEAVLQLACDLVVMYEVIQRRSRRDRERLRDHFVYLLQLRVLTLQPGSNCVQFGESVPGREMQERLLEVAGIASKSHGNLPSDFGYLSSPPALRDWAYDRMRDLFHLDEPPVLGLLRDSHGPVRLRAAEIVKQDRERYLPFLLRMLDEQKAAHRIGALLALSGHPDPEVRWEIAQRLKDPRKTVAEAAAEALGGLEAALLSDPDPRVVKAAVVRLLRLPAEEIKQVKLQAGLKRLFKEKDPSQLTVSRYRWAAVLLSRSPDPESTALALWAAVRSRTCMDDATKAMLIDHLALRELHRRTTAEGAVAAVHRARPTHMAFEARLVTILNRVDEFRWRVEEIGKTAGAGHRETMIAHARSRCALEILNAPIRPGATYREREIVKDTLRVMTLKLREITSSMEGLERNLLAVGAYLAERPVEEACKLHASTAWLTAEPWDRAALAVMLLFLKKNPRRLEEFVMEAYREEIPPHKAGGRPGRR